ncbi:MAG: (2Fe-2S)-binding protein [Alphaproteobacteria bacterium]|nr:(2Fe-2S)-binding protein [Alphaproteobacteria bacterium]
MIEQAVTVTVNGIRQRASVQPRQLLVHFLRNTLALTGTHVGCDTAYCGACTVQLDGQAVKSCNLFTVQADGRRVDTVEGLARGGEPSALQAAFSRHHALQCGYCTPGMLMSATALLQSNAAASDPEVRKALAGNVCRCTGYQTIVAAVLDAAARMKREAA